MRLRWLILLLLSALASAQSTSVTATVLDAGGIPWANGTYTFSFVGPPNAQWNGGPYNFNVPITGALSTSGGFSVSVPDNAQINPPGTQWLVKACSATVPMACSSRSLTITGGAQTIVLTPPAIVVTEPTSPTLVSPVIAYADAEIQGAWVGFTYYNLITGGPRVCQAVALNTCITWASVGGPAAPTLSISVTPSSLSFGTVQVGGSQTQNVTVAITGTGAVSVQPPVFTTGTKFSSSTPGACAGLLAAGSQCSLPVTYTPTASTVDSDTLTFTSSAPIDPQNPLKVSLAGTGQAAATFLVSLPPLGTGNGNVTDTANANALNATYSSTGCTGQCSFSYPTGTPIVLAATAFPGFTFGGFSGAGLSTSPASLTVTQAQTIGVTFNAAVPDEVLTLAATGQGGGSLVSNVPIDGSTGILSCTALAGVTSSGGSSGCFGPFLQGTIVTITPTANASSTFTGWSGAPAGTCTGTSPCAITVNSAVTLTANFASNAVQPSLVQTSTNCSVSGTTIVCPWTSAQNAGDFLIIGGAWPDNTTTVSSIADTKGNTYTQVPTISPKTTTGLTQVLYYAQNIGASLAGANSTTMTLSTSAASTVAGTALATGSAAGGASSIATSTSPTLANNDLILASVWANLGSGNGPTAFSSVTGCGLTWVFVNSADFGSVQGTGKTGRIETWRTLGNGNSCTVTANFATSPTTRYIAVSEFSGVSTTGSNGSGAVGINASNFGHNTAASVTMGTFGSASNGTFAAAATNGGTAITAGSGMTALNTAVNSHLADEWAATNQATPGFGGTTATDWGEIGIEIVANGSSGRRDIRALEYAGIKTSGNPIDVDAAAVGSSASAAPGSITPGTANDLITDFTLSASSVNTPATGYTQRVKNSFGDDEEDVEGASTAATNPSVALTSSANWIASNVAWLSANASAPTAFSVSLSVVGPGSVTSNVGTPPLGCPSVCSSQVPANSTAVLQAFPSAGAVLVGWSGITGCSTSATCTIPNITANQNVTATFALSGVLTYYVNHLTGSDSNSATQAQSPSTPWLTIGHAASSVTIGATGTLVIVHGCPTCAYNETVTLPKGGTSINAYLQFECDTAWTVGSLTGCSGTHWNTYNVNYVKIGALPKLGFEYSNPSDIVAVDNVANGCTAPCTDATANYIQALGNYWHNINTSGTCGSSGAFLSGQHGVLTTGIVAIGNQGDLIGLNASCNTMQGIYIVSSGAVIELNIMTRVTGGGIQFYDQACNGILSNNIVANNRFGFNFEGANGCTPGLNTFDNNVVVNNSSGGIYNSGAGDCTSGRNTLYAHNDFFGNGTNFSNQQACDVISGDVSENPTASFTNYTGDATGTYTLQGGSILNSGGTTACINGGTSPCVPAVNFNNLPNPQVGQTAWNIGIF